MRFLLAFSEEDPAGRGAAERLAADAGGGCRLPHATRCWRLGHLDAVLAGFHGETIDFDFLDEAAPWAEAYIVLSKHSGGRPSLTVHYPGNPGAEARLGGRPRELSYTWPRLHAALARSYRRVAEELGLLSEFQFVLEATHHGPTGLRRPVVFIEIGSGPQEWRRSDAHQAMAEALREALSRPPEETSCARIAVGLGDTHYPRSHTRAVVEKGFCYTHIFSKHALPGLDEELLDQAVGKSRDPVDSLALAKVPGAVKRLALAFAEKRGLEAVKP